MTAVIFFFFLIFKITGSFFRGLYKLKVACRQRKPETMLLQADHPNCSRHHDVTRDM